MVYGLLWIIGGMGLTIATYIAASSGGQYWIAYGAIVYGLFRFFTGLAAARGTDTKAQAQELLNTAAQLESVDLTKALALYAEIIERFPGTRASAEAQENVRTLTHSLKGKEDESVLFSGGSGSSATRDKS